jgi:uroporphyrinogen decarboxylase
LAYAGVLKDIRRCLARQTPSRVPYFPISVMFDYHHFGYSYARWRNEPQVMAELGQKAVAKFDYDVYMLHPDDLLEYEGSGIRIQAEEDLPAAVAEYLPATETTLRGLRIPANLGKAGRLARHLEGLAALKQALGASVCLSGRIAAPFTTLTLILGIEPTLVLMLEDPALLRLFEEFFLEYNDRVAQLQLAAGADALWLGDCVATSHFISPAQYQEHAAEFAAASARRIRAAGGIVFYHGNERSIPHLQIMAGLGFDAINVGEGVDIGEVKRAIGGRVCIMGNLDPLHDLQPRSSQEVEKVVQEIVEKAKPGGGYLFCTGEGVPHNTPVENMQAMHRAVRNYGEY